jgi:hypothetical protein
MNETSPSESQKPAITSTPLDADLERELNDALSDQSIDELMEQSVSQAAAADQPPDAAETDASAPPQPRHVSDLKRGRISAISGDEVFVELSGMDSRMQGVVPLSQFERQPRVGSIMDFVVERVDEAEGVMHLSREGAIGAATWDTLHKGSTIEGRVVGTNKGGLDMELSGGIRAFMPASDCHRMPPRRKARGPQPP